MPINDPGGNYASGGAVNQGGPVGNTGSSNAGSNVRPGYGPSQGYQPGGSMVFGPPLMPNGLSADQFEAFTNPNVINYTDTPRQPGGSLSGGPAGRFQGTRNPSGAGGSNSGQGGMGAGRINPARRAALVRALGGGGGVRMG